MTIMMIIPRIELHLSSFSVEGGELFDRIVDENYKLTELDAIVFTKQICEGVQYLHQQYILHLDLKVTTHLHRVVPRPHCPATPTVCWVCGPAWCPKRTGFGVFVAQLETLDAVLDRSVGFAAVVSSVLWWVKPIAMCVMFTQLTCVFDLISCYSVLS